MSEVSFADLAQIMRGFQESRVLLTAVELDLFTAVGQGATASEAARRCGTDPRATEALLHAVAALGALVKKDGIFYNTAETARYLVADSPDSARAAMMHTVHLWRRWDALTGCVRSGAPAPRAEGGAGDAEWTRSFIAAMHRNAEMHAPAMVRAVGSAGVRRLLDIGGGSGAYSIAFAKSAPELYAEVFDLAPVVEIARGHIAQAALADRVTARTGDLRTDKFGSDYDLILLSAICHMLGPEENQDLFRRCYRALGAGGRLVVRDFILEPDKTAPKFAALFAINMLVGTRNGSTYTEAEYRSWLAAAGFAECVRPDPAGDLLIARR
ncbi:MAG TPA: methyltransferase [Bryobacteraceae bacterium]|nr:methyltransferase [Bryobacteraceae bacterium]